MCVSVVYVCLLILVRQTVFSSYPHALSYFPAEYFRANSWLAGSQQSTPLPLLSLSSSMSRSLFVAVCPQTPILPSYVACFVLSLPSVRERDASVPRICFARSPHLLLSLSFLIRSSLGQRSLPRAAASPSKELRSPTYSVRGRNLKQVMSQGSHPAHL